jgi:hypothetical protein
MASTATIPMLSPEGGLTHYLTEIRKFPMLRPDEESAYGKRWREQGDSEAAYAHRPPTRSIRSCPRRRDIQFRSVPRVARRAARTSSRKWRITCGRRPLSTTMLSTSMLCCIQTRSSITQRTSWWILRCRRPRDARFWRPGHRMHRRSLRVPRCGRLSASKRPSLSTRYWKLSANSMAVRAIRRAASRTVCVQLPGLWQPGREDAMDEIKLPHHVVDRLERRWKARFAQILASRGSGGQPAESMTPSIAASLAASGRILTAAEVG